MLKYKVLPILSLRRVLFTEQKTENRIVMASSGDSKNSEKQNKGFAIVFAEELYEDLELHYPRLRLIEAGYTVAVVAPLVKQVYKSKFGYWATSTHTFADIDPKQVKVLFSAYNQKNCRLLLFPEDFVLIN